MKRILLAITCCFLFTLTAFAQNANVAESRLNCVDGGSTDSYACSLSPAIPAYRAGAHYRFKANTANTGAATINFNSLGAKTIKKVAGGVTTDLDTNDIRVGQWVDVVYDGTNMQMQSLLGNAPASGAPSSATYITETADGTLSNEFALGSLATGILKSTTTTGVPSIATVDDISSPQFCSDAGANDTYTCNLSPSISSYVTGTHYRFKANTANTGAATINLNSVGAKTIKKAEGGVTTDLADNDIRAGQWVDLIYDGTNMQMQSNLGNASSGGGLTVGTTTITSGTNTRVPFNDSGVYGEDAELTYNKTSNTLIAQNVNPGSLDGGNSGTTSNYWANVYGTNINARTKIAWNGQASNNDAVRFDAPNNAAGSNGLGPIRVRENNVSTGSTFAYTPESPAQITADQNNYSPSSNSKYQRWSTDASRNITGWLPWGGVANLAGAEYVITNVGSADIVLKHESASSTAANRFLNSTGADITLSANQAADVWYDGTTARWRVFKRN